MSDDQLQRKLEAKENCIVHIETEDGDGKIDWVAIGIIFLQALCFTIFVRLIFF